MKFIVLILLLSHFFSSCKSQESEKSSLKNVEVSVSDESFANSYKDQILALFDIYRKSQSAAVPKSELNSKLSLVTDPKLYKAKQVIIEFTKRSPNLISDKFLRKPDLHTLEAIHHIEKIGIKSFTAEKVDLKSFINDGVKTISKEELLTKYYKILFSRVNRMMNTDFSTYNISFATLGLKTDEEKASLFLISMNVFGRKFMREARMDCGKATAYALKLPKFESLDFYDYKLTEFEDFLVWIDNSKGYSSFQKYYMSFYENAMIAYKNCN